MKYSLIIPVFNEQDSIEELYRELLEVIGPLGESFEYIYVNDGSTDASAERIAALESLDERVQGIHLARNFGKSAAYTAGFNAAQGEIIVTIDGDLQDDPYELPKLLEKFNAGSDLVIGAKENRFETEPKKKIPSIVFNFMLYLFFGLRTRDSNSGYRVMRREVAESLRLYGDNYRFIPQLAHLQGFAVSEIDVHHRKRKYGQTKYGPTRFLTGLIDIASVGFLTAFREKPLHFFGIAASIPIVAGIGLAIYVLVAKLLGDTFREHIAALISGIFLMLLGFQTFSIGLLAEILTSSERYKRHRVRTKALR